VKGLKFNKNILRITSRTINHFFLKKYLRFLPMTTDHPVGVFVSYANAGPQERFVTSIAPETVEVLEGHLLFPGGYFLQFCVAVY